MASRRRLNSSDTSSSSMLKSTTISFKPPSSGPDREDDGIGSDQEDGDRTALPRENQRSSKRRRVALACNACRTRKSRCNGSRPKCAMCDTLGYDCVYEASDSSTNIIVQKEYIAGLAERLLALEKHVQKHDRMFNSHSLCKTSSACQPRVQIDVHGEMQRSGEADLSNSSISLRDTELQELPPEESLTDGMAMSFIDETDNAFFGQSSNISLVKHLVQAMANAGGPENLTSPMKTDDVTLMDNEIFSASRPSSPLRMTYRHPNSAQRRDDNYYALPSEHETRILIEHYFSNTGVLFPYIHKPSFLHEYDRFKASNFSKARRTWLGLLNMVLAMSSNTIVDPKKAAMDRISESDLFYRRAMALCDRQILRGTNLETVQYLLLMSQYLQGTQMSVQTWTIHGLAVKAALSIGLHSTDAARKFPLLEQEIRKRTWFGCVVLDRSLSMTFGRPPAIPQYYVRLSLPQPLHDDDQIAQNDAETLSVSFFTTTITLYQVLHDVIAELYGQNLGCEESPLDITETITKIFQLERSLRSWELTLPPQVNLIDTENIQLEGYTDPVLQRFRIILTLRKLNLDILLHRPMLIRAMEPYGNSEETRIPGVSPAMLKMQANALQTCVQSAESIISIIHAISTAESEKRQLLGAWWFSLYYVFNAALVIFSGLFAPRGQQQIIDVNSDRCQRCFKFVAKAIETLQHLDTGNVTISRCSNYLLHLSNSLQSWLGNGMIHSFPDTNFLQISEAQAPLQMMNTSGLNLDGTVPNGRYDEFQNVYGHDSLDLGQFFVPNDLSMPWLNPQYQQ